MWRNADGEGEKSHVTFTSETTSFLFVVEALHKMGCLKLFTFVGLLCWVGALTR